MARFLPFVVRRDEIPEVKATWILLLPALAPGQTPDNLPVQHDSVDVHGAAPDTPAVSSPATPVKGPATVNDALPLLPGIVRSPDGGLRIRLSVTGNTLSNHFNALAIHANVADPLFGTFFGNYPRRFRADFDVIF